MSSFFVDANVIIDFLMDRAPFSIHAADLFEMALQGKINVFVAAVSFNNIYYVIRKKIGHQAAILKLKKISSFCNVLDVTHTIIKNALDSDNTDFEDAIQYYSALSNPKIEAIITRDIKGFKKSELPVLKPLEALHRISLY